MLVAGLRARWDGLITFRCCETRRPPKAGASPNGRRRLCGEAKRAEARAGAGAFSSQAKSLGGSENAIKHTPKGGSATIRDA